MASSDPVVSWAAFELDRRLQRADTLQKRSQVWRDADRARRDPEFRARLAQIAEFGKWSSGAPLKTKLGLAAGALSPIVFPPLAPLGFASGAALAGMAIPTGHEALQRRSEGLPWKWQAAESVLDLAAPGVSKIGGLLRGLRGVKPQAIATIPKRTGAERVGGVFQAPGVQQTNWERVASEARRRGVHPEQTRALPGPGEVGGPATPTARRMSPSVQSSAGQLADQGRLRSGDAGWLPETPITGRLVTPPVARQAAPKISSTPLLRESQDPVTRASRAIRTVVRPKATLEEATEKVLEGQSRAARPLPPSPAPLVQRLRVPRPVPRPVVPPAAQKIPSAPLSSEGPAPVIPAARALPTVGEIPSAAAKTLTTPVIRPPEIPGTGVPDIDLALSKMEMGQTGHYLHATRESWFRPFIKSIGDNPALFTALMKADPKAQLTMLDKMLRFKIPGGPTGKEFYRSPQYLFGTIGKGGTPTRRVKAGQIPGDYPIEHFPLEGLPSKNVLAGFQAASKAEWSFAKEQIPKQFKHLKPAFDKLRTSDPRKRSAIAYQVVRHRFDFLSEFMVRMTHVPGEKGLSGVTKLAPEIRRIASKSEDRNIGRVIRSAASGSIQEGQVAHLDKITDQLSKVAMQLMLLIGGTAVAQRMMPQEGVDAAYR